MAYMTYGTIALMLLGLACVALLVAGGAL